MTDQETFLVLGANGFLGQTVTQALLNNGMSVRAFDIAHDIQTNERKAESLKEVSKKLELYEGSVFDAEYLTKVMQGVHTVCMFISFSVPSSAPGYMSNELETTLNALEKVLHSMVLCGVEKIIFPSSGGTIYGETNGMDASESHPLRPESSYGMGKALAEAIIQFYARVHGIKYLILRISNPYGVTHLRRTTQGVIDVFLQKLMAGEPIQLWGNLDIVRDYIFLDDFVDAFVKLINLGIENQILNVGTGHGSTLKDIINCIEVVTEQRIAFSRIETAYSGLQHVVLDTSLLRNLTGWKPSYSLMDGIRISWARKHHTS